MVEVRRVVTGHDESGRAVFVSDGPGAPFVPAYAPQSAYHSLWRFDETPSFPDDGAEPPPSTYFPRVGGFRFNLFTIAPDGAPPPADLDVRAALDETRSALPGLLEVLEPDHPGMHTTSTLDVEVVLTGTPVLELDDGATVLLHPGDTVVQNGTRHRWSNPGTEPATLAVVLVGAHHAQVPPH